MLHSDIVSQQQRSSYLHINTILLLLRQKDVFQLRHGGRLELVKTRQSLRDCRSINRIDVELRSICFGDEITIL